MICEGIKENNNVLPFFFTSKPVSRPSRICFVSFDVQKADVGAETGIVYNISSSMELIVLEKHVEMAFLP